MEVKMIREEKSLDTQKTIIILLYWDSKRILGKGYATNMGLTYSKGDTVVILDSDLNINPSWIVDYVNALRYGDIIIASK